LEGLGLFFRNVARSLTIYTLLGLLIAPSFVLAKRAENIAITRESKANPLVGAASFYGNKFQGKRTANGEKFDNNVFSAAHKSLRFGSRVKVINVRNGLSVVVRVNDRGPFIRGRIIDLSKAAAKKIGLTRSGTVIVRLEIIH
jgi:rare lipoprotein A